MAKKRDIGAEILDGLRELKSGRRGRIISIPRIADIRKKTGLSQSHFATLLGVSVRTVQRRWHHALQILHEKVGADWPDSF